MWKDMRSYTFKAVHMSSGVKIQTIIFLFNRLVLLMALNLKLRA
jgi:hypothetical protein